MIQKFFSSKFNSTLLSTLMLALVISACGSGSGNSAGVGVNNTVQNNLLQSKKSYTLLKNGQYNHVILIAYNQNGTTIKGLNSASYISSAAGTTVNLNVGSDVVYAPLTTDALNSLVSTYGDMIDQTDLTAHMSDYRSVTWQGAALATGDYTVNYVFSLSDGTTGPISESLSF